MKNIEEINYRKKQIKRNELELKQIIELKKQLENNDKVQEYIRLMDTYKEVYDYVILSNKERNIDTKLKQKRKELKELIKKSCTHDIVIVNDDINDVREYYNCTCLECQKDIYTSLNNSYIYATENFTMEDIPIVKAQYQELKNMGKAADERIVIMNIDKKKKVKSRK